MYEVIEKRKMLPDGTEISTYTREVISANILEVEAGTTGYMGSDSGHGGRTYFRIRTAPALIWKSAHLWISTAATALKFSSAATVSWKPLSGAEVYHQGAGEGI